MTVDPIYTLTGLIFARINFRVFREIKSARKIENFAVREIKSA